MNLNTHISHNPKSATELYASVDYIAKRRLTIQFDATRLMVLINKDFIPPVSWFLTDALGELSAMGQIKDHNFKINLSGLPTGTYNLRIAGEVFVVNHNT